MLSHIFKFLLIELAIFAGILAMTKSDLLYDLSAPEPLTAAIAGDLQELSYDRLYTIDHKMKHWFPIETEDGKRGSLMWPDEPYGPFIILVDHQEDILREKTDFQGRAIRCLGKCLTENFLIEMFPVVESLEKAYPEYKKKYDMLPSVLIDTTQQPQGLKGYINKTKIYWSVFAFCLSLGGFLLIRAILKEWDESPKTGLLSPSSATADYGEQVISLRLIAMTSHEPLVPRREPPKKIIRTVDQIDQESFFYLRT